METTLVKRENVISATLLVAGCSIGAGMIGLPVVSALAGFIPSTLAMILCYFFATGTGLLLVEATLWFDHKVNLVSLADFALGKFGKLVTWSLFLFLFYCLFVAYIEGGGQLFSGVLSAIFDTPVSREVGILTCVSLVGASVYAGINAVSGMNRLFMLFLAASYCTLIILGAPHINSNQLLFIDWKATLTVIPILLVCFGYQNLVPTLTYYVKKDIQVVRFAIFVGNMIPFLVYFLWNFVILGLLPEDYSVLAKVAGQNEMVTGLLAQASQSQAVLVAVQTFSFFAILTPFMGNTLAFVDFLKDGLKMNSQSKYNILIYALVLIPPMLLTLSYPHLFLKALGLVGGLADVMLFGILPVLIVYTGRYIKKVESSYQVAGGKLFLAAILFVSVSVLLIRG